LIPIKQLEPAVWFASGTKLTDYPMKVASSNLLTLTLLLAWISNVGLVGFCQSSSGNGKVTTAEEYGRLAMLQEGDAARGQKLFADEQRVACAKCHSVNGKGAKAGPDLFAVGDRFSRRDLIDAVLTPSATIADGYGTILVETKSGEEYQGTLKQVTDAGVELMGGDGKVIRIAAGDIQEQRGSLVSLMPEGLQAGLSVEEFTDLIEYLVSLKEAAHALTSYQGMPETIPQLPRPILLRPLFQEDLHVPPPSAPAPGNNTSGLVWFGQVPGFAGRYLVVHQTGRIWLLEKKAGNVTTSVFADFTPEVFSARGPNGLLGLAFHPRFRENRKYYLKHQVFEDGRIATVLVEKLAAPDFRKDSGRPSRRLLKIVSVAEHHNGGCIQFGPDGFLYFGMGDSAPNDDPQGYGQDLQLLLGKMLRLDVDGRGAGWPYGIPVDNPFRGRMDARPEIWAYGLREPWRFSFDPVRGDLWVADLGQERGDEVAIVRRGENHGWNVYEGFELFSNKHRREGEVYVPPIFANRRKHGSAVIGGYVYRGDPGSSFYGVYVFGDHQSKRIWGLRQDRRSLKTIRHLATAPQSITSFATDEGGNIYVVGYQGMVYQLDFTGANFDGPVGVFSAPSAGSGGTTNPENVLVRGMPLEHSPDRSNGPPSPVAP
jgi:putative heme-binding domain-containing protein